MRPTRWVLTLVVGAAVGAAVGFALVWLLVAVAALEHDRMDVGAPPHVVVVSGLLGASLLAVSARALVTSSRRATWATAVVLAPVSLAWAMDPESAPWVRIGVATAVVLAGALLGLEVLPGRGPTVPPRRTVVVPLAVLAAAVLAVCAVPAVDFVHVAVAHGLDLMLYHQEEESVLYSVLPPFVLGGVALGVLRETLRRRVSTAAVRA